MTLQFRLNPLAFPPVRAPRLNTAHPMARFGHLQLAAVAGVSGGMTDLVTGKVATNTATLTEVNESGPCVFGTAVDSSVFLSWPYSGPATVNDTTIAAIFKYIAPATTNQWLILYDTNWGLKIQSNNIALVFNNGNRDFQTLIAGHTYYILAQFALGSSQTAIFVLLDMTTGILIGSIPGGAVAAAAITGFSILQGNDASTSGKNRLIAAAVMVGTSANPAALSLADAMACANDPWGLWYS